MSSPQKYAAVFTDSRPLMNLDIFAAGHMRFLPKGWDCLFFTCAKNAYVAKMGARLIEISEEATDTYEKFNQFRTSVDMWSKLVELGYDRVLIFEQDSRILRTGIEEFLEWDYIGAPWPEHEEWHKGNRVGNGGLSLRNPAMMLRIVQTHKKPDDIACEDHFFSIHMKDMGIKVAPTEAAKRFSCERDFALGTFGCHAISRYMTPYQVDAILRQYERSANGDSCEMIEEEFVKKIMLKLENSEKALNEISERVNRIWL